MATQSCNHKLLRISGVIKAPAFKSLSSSTLTGRGGGGNLVSSAQLSTKSVTRPCQILQNAASISTSFQILKNRPNGYVGVASMSSWLRSSVIFIKGTGDNGGGGGDVPPHQPRRPRTGKELGETSIFRQEGHSIEEVPAAVIRSDSDQKPRKGPPKTYVDLHPSEEAAFVEGFSKFSTPQQVLTMLDTIPSQEVTPFVSFSILKKLFELESNFGFRNQGKTWLNVSDNSSTETFARLAIVTRLMDTILTCEDNSLLLETLDLMRRECPHINDQTYGLYDPANPMDYRNKLMQEILIRVTEGKLDLSQVCNVVVILGKMENDKGYTFNKDFIDKFWVGILDHNEDISPENIVSLIKTVKYFKRSSRLVLNLIERKLVSLWWKMDTKTVAEICSVFTSDDGPIQPLTVKKGSIASWQISARLLMTLSKCTNLNIHKVTEGELLKIVKAFHNLNFCDGAIEQALNKYMKAKVLKITDPQLVSYISDYARKFRLRSNILDAAAEFVVKHEGKNLTPPQLVNILRPLGELDFHPPQGSRFWEIVENYLNEKFIQFPPPDLIEVFLSCVYLKKYPINFVDRIFSPYFLDRLHTSEADFILLQQHRSNLKLLDIAMTIENKGKYNGPILPKDFSSRTIFIDGRIHRMIPVVKETLLGLCPNSSIDTSLILPGLPLNAIFTADLLLTTPKIDSEVERSATLRSHINSALFYSPTSTTSKSSSDFTAILVHIPEHYSSDNKHLIGLQNMRGRLLETLGFKVVHLRFSKLIDAKGDFILLSEYIMEKLKDSNFLPD